MKKKELRQELHEAIEKVFFFNENSKESREKRQLYKEKIEALKVILNSYDKKKRKRWRARLDIQNNTTLAIKKVFDQPTETLNIDRMFTLQTKHQVCIELASTSQYEFYKLFDQYEKLKMYMNEKKVGSMLNEAVVSASKYNLDLNDVINSTIQMVKIFR
jgi:hypothetical protein